MAKIAHGYDVHGRLTTITSSSAPDVVVNQVERVYNGLGLLTSEKQSHAGSVTVNTPAVRYVYDTSATGEGEYFRGLRPVRLFYPTSRIVSYLYDGHDHVLHRP